MPLKKAESVAARYIAAKAQRLGAFRLEQTTEHVTQHYDPAISLLLSKY